MFCRHDVMGLYLGGHIYGGAYILETNWFTYLRGVYYSGLVGVGAYIRGWWGGGAGVLAGFYGTLNRFINNWTKLYWY